MDCARSRTIARFDHPRSRLMGSPLHPYRAVISRHAYQIREKAETEERVAISETEFTYQGGIDNEVR